MIEYGDYDDPEISREKKQKISEIYNDEHYSIKILVTGRTGSGKTTIINGFLGLKCNELISNTSLNPDTKNVRKYERDAFQRKCPVDMTIWDSPGLQDGNDEASYLQEINDNCFPCDLKLYCISVKETRFSPSVDTNPDIKAMRSLTQKFGPDFWQNTVIVLTFANIIEHIHPEWKDWSQEDKNKAFNKKIECWKKEIRNALRGPIALDEKTVESIQIEPAGHPGNPHLHATEYWFSRLWFVCLLASQSDTKAQENILRLNASRLIHKNDVDSGQIAQQSLNEQKIVVDPEELVRKYKIGGALLGLLFGPLAVITSPVGAVIGGEIGKKMMQQVCMA